MERREAPNKAASSAWAVLMVVLMVLPVVVAPSSVAAGGHGTGPVDLIVGLDRVPSAVGPGDRFEGGEVVRTSHALGFIVVRAGGGSDDPETVRARAEARGDVRYVEPDTVHQWVRFVPDDPRWDDQHGPQHVNATAAWDGVRGGTERTVCIADTGVRYTHEDLAPNWLGGTDVFNGDPDPWDDHGHGTHVAGIAAAALDNGLGIAGIGNVGIYGVKVLGASGSGSTSIVAQGIEWCADQGADVINLSLGASSGSFAMEDAVNYAWSAGSLVVAAAGNDGPCADCIGFPAAYANAIAVTCTDSIDSKCSFSNAGPEAELAAPGLSILATGFGHDSSYVTKSGTSMSTPHVAGVAALIWNDVPHATNQDIRSVLTTTAVDLGAGGRDHTYGYGLVEASAALQLLRDLLGGPNDLPVADAGPDQALIDHYGVGSVEVTLDGSSSADPDGFLVAHTWHDADGNELATGPTATITLPTATHAIGLTVEDNRGATATDVVNVAIVENLPPVAAFDIACEALACTFDAAPSDDPEGATLGYAWTVHGTTLGGSGQVLAAELPAAGTYVACLTVDDGFRADETCRTVTPRVPIADDPAGDAPGLIEDNVDALDLIGLEAATEANVTTTFWLTVAELPAPPVAPADGAQELVWRVAWEDPDGTGFVQLSMGAFGVQCGYGQRVGGVWTQQGTAPCSVTPGPQGVVELTVPGGVLLNHGLGATDTLTDVRATGAAYRGTPQALPVWAGLTDEVDAMGPAAYAYRTPA